MKIISPIVIAILITAGILTLSGQASKIGIKISNNSFINFQINYQLFLLGFALISMISSYLFNPESFKSILSFGNISSTGEELRLFGIKKGDGWLKTGISISLFISLATATFRYFQLNGQTIHYGLLKTGLYWIILFSLTNSFSEEIIY